MASEDKQPRRSLLGRLKRLSLAGTVTLAPMGMPENASAGPIVMPGRPIENSDEMWDTSNLREAMYNQFVHAPLKKQGDHLVLDLNTDRLADKFWRENNAREDGKKYSQKVAYKAAVQLSTWEQEKAKIPAGEREAIQPQLDQFLNPNGTEPLTREQIHQLCAAVEQFFNRMASRLMPPMPKQHPVSRKGSPPAYVMCTPDDPKYIWGENYSFDYHVQRYWKWNVIKDSLAAAGADIYVISEGNAATLRQIYTANPVFYVPQQKTVYIPKKNADSRQRSEQKALIEGFTKRNVTVKEVDANFNGGNMYYFEPLKTVFMGSVAFDKEVTPQDIEAFEQASGLKVQIVPMSRKHEPEWEEKRGHGYRTPWYDLDCFMVPLPPASAGASSLMMYYPGATTPEGEAMLRQTIGQDNLLAISRDDALKLACNLNAVEGGDGKYTLVMPHCSQELQERLNGLGYRVISPRTLGLADDILEIGGGSVHCMTQPIGKDFPIDIFANFPYIDLIDPRRKKLEDMLGIETPDGKQQLTFAELIEMQDKRDRERNSGIS